MLTWRANAYNSSCSQTAVSLSPAISSQFILAVCSAAKDRKNQQKSVILEDQSLSKSSMLIRLKSSLLVLVLIGSVPMLICNRFHERLANNGKITTFRGYRSLMLSCADFFESKKSRLRRSIEIYVECWKFNTQLVHVHLSLFRRNSLLKCVLQPDIAKNP